MTGLFARLRLFKEVGAWRENDGGGGTLSSTSHIKFYIVGPRKHMIAWVLAQRWEHFEGGGGSI